MISQKFEDRLEEILRHWTGPWSESAILGKLSAEEREWVTRSPQAKQLLSDWIWIHRYARLLHSPTAPEGFADRVLARAQVSRRSMGPGTSDRGLVRRRVVWASAAVALAAVVLIALIIAPIVDAPLAEPKTVASVDPPRPTENEMPLGDGGADFLPIAENRAVPTTEPSYQQFSKDSVSERASEEESTMVAMLGGDSKPRLRQAIVESTGSIMDTGRELQHRIEPVTNSAMGAFDFLWRNQPESSSGKKPSI